MRWLFLYMENKTDILGPVADTVTGKAIRFEVTIRPQNKWHAWLIKKGWRPKKKEFTIQPIVLGNLMQISRLLLTIDTEALQGKITLEGLYKLISSHSDTVIRVLAIAIQGTRSDPESSLIRLITDNLTTEESMKLLRYLLTQMDLKNFTNSIISIRGLSALQNAGQRKEENEVSPMSQRSQIAPGK